MIQLLINISINILNKFKIIFRDDFYEVPIEFYMNKIDSEIVDELW